MKKYELEVFSYKLFNSSPESIYEELAKYYQSSSEGGVYHNLWIDDENFEEIESKLLHKNHPLINLALAQFSPNGDVLYSLYKEGSEAIKFACLNNKFVNRLLATFNRNNDSLYKKISDDEWEVLLNNKNISDKVLVDLFERSKDFADFDEEKWRLLISYSSKNQRLSTSYEENNKFLDGYADYQYNLVFEKGWQLLEKVPTTTEWAHVLSALTFKMLPTHGEKNVKSLLDRWKDVEESKNKDLSSFGFLRINIARLIPSYSKLFKDLKNSEDLALRTAYYGRFECYNPDELVSLFEKDGDDFLFASVSNDNLYSRANVRDQLQSLTFKAENSDLLYYNLFKSHIERLRKQDPAKYLTEDEDIFSNQEVENKDTNQEFTELSGKFDRLLEKNQTLTTVLYWFMAIVFLKLIISNF
jgi:hypothetical protein